MFGMVIKYFDILIRQKMVFIKASKLLITFIYWLLKTLLKIHLGDKHSQSKTEDPSVM